MVEPPKLRGATLSEVSQYATVIGINLEEWGGVERSRLGLRLSGDSLQVVTAILRQPKSPQMAKVVGDVLDHAYLLGFRNAWYGLPGPYPPLEENLATVGFERLNRFTRFRISVPTQSTEHQPDLRMSTRPIDFGQSLKPFQNFFRISQELAGGSNTQFDLELELRLTCHEITVAQWNPAYSWITEGSEIVGALGLVVVPQGEAGKMAVTAFYLDRNHWEPDRFAEIMQLVTRRAQEREATSIMVSCESSQVKRSDLFTRFGFQADADGPVQLFRRSRVQTLARSEPI